MTQIPYPYQVHRGYWMDLFKILSTRYHEREWRSINCPVELTEQLIEIAKNYVVGSSTTSDEGLVELWDTTFQRLEVNDYAAPLYAWGQEIIRQEETYTRMLLNLEAAFNAWSLNESEAKSGNSIPDLPLSMERKIAIAKAYFQIVFIGKRHQHNLGWNEARFYKGINYGYVTEWDQLIYHDCIRMIDIITCLDIRLTALRKILCDLTEEELKALKRWYARMAEMLALDPDISFVQLAHDLCSETGP